MERNWDSFHTEREKFVRISIFGLGYVGTVSAACLAADGHQVVGVDPIASKVGLINEGKAPIVGVEIDEILKSVVAEGRLRATTDAGEAINATEASFVCV